MRHEEEQVKCTDCGAACAYCDMRDDGENDPVCESCYRTWFIESALAAGIPRAVVEGTAKLTDFFSKEYISVQCGRKENL